MSSDKRKVLIVEDDVFLLKVLKQKFEGKGFDTKLAEDGEVAFKVLKEFIPDIILLDLLMPNKDGFDVLKELHQNEQYKNIPVVIITNLGQASDKEKASSYDIAAYLVKSDVSIDKTVKIVEKVLAK